MFFSKKRKQRKKEEKNFRLHNEILRKSHELEKLFTKLEEIKAKAKSEKNENMKQFIANEYIQIENRIKIFTVQLKDLQKTYLANLDIMSKEELLNTYKEIDKYKISDNKDLIKIVEKIANIQQERITEDKERVDIDEVFTESLESYSANINNERAKELLNEWAKEVEQEEFEKESEQGELSHAEDNKEVEA